MMLTVVLVCSLGAPPDLRPWREMLLPGAKAARLFDRYGILEHTQSGKFPDGVVWGEVAYVFWPDSIVTLPVLTAIELPTGKLRWQWPVVGHLSRMIVGQAGIAVLGQLDEADAGRWSVRLLDHETGAEIARVPPVEGDWIDDLTPRWALYNSGTVRDLQTGKLVDEIPKFAVLETIVVDDELVSFAASTSGYEQERPLRRINLVTGKIAAEVMTRGELVAADRRNELLLNVHRRTDGSESEAVLVRMNVSSGETVWRTTLAPHAPIRLAGAPLELVGLGDPAAGTYLGGNTPVHVDWETGHAEIDATWTSPGACFGWHWRKPVRQARLIDNQLIGGLRAIENTTQVETLISIDPLTCQVRWQIEFGVSEPAQKWFREAHPAPHYAVLSNYCKLTVVEYGTGQETTIRPEQWGLKLTPPDRPPAVPSPDVTAGTSSPSAPPPSAERMPYGVVACAAGFGIVVLLWMRQSRRRVTPR